MKTIILATLLIVNSTTTTLAQTIIPKQTPVKPNIEKTTYIEEHRTTSANWTIDINSKPVYKTDYIPVLMYHDFMEDTKLTKDKYSSTVGTLKFTEHLQALKDNGYETISFYDLHRYLNGEAGLPEKPVIITTDDGYISNYTLAYPILKQFNMKATYFVSSRYVGVQNPWNDHFDWEEALEMQNSGLIDIQSHTVNHSKMSTLTKEQVIFEVTNSFKVIEEHLGERQIKVFAYPEFKHTKETQKTLKDLGVSYQMTNLAKPDNFGNHYEDTKRIHVQHTTSGEDLIKMIESLTK